MTVTPIHPALSSGNAAVITGAASGIGLAAAKRFAAMGLRVCLADRDEGKLAGNCSPPKFWSGFGI